MKIRISANTAFTRHFIEIADDGVWLYESSGLGGTSLKVRYDDIIAVLRSNQSVLSVQTGRQTFKIPVNPQNPEHRTAVARLVSNCKRTQKRSDRVPTFSQPLEETR